MLNVIWDISPGALALLDLDSIKASLQDQSSHLERRRGGHSFLVTHKASEEALAKWMQAFSQQMKNQPVAFHVAQSVPDAIRELKRLRQDGKGISAQS